MATVTNIQLNIGQDLSTVTIGDSKVEVSADGKKVTAYTNDNIEVKTDSPPAKNHTKISISEDFNTIVLNGVTIEQATDGHLVITAPDVTVINKSAPATDTSAIALHIGQKTADGSVFAGMTDDGKQQIFAMPKDLDVTMTFSDTERAVYKLNRQNALGHNDWQIPSLETLRVLYKNKNEGALTHTFSTSSKKGNGCSYPGFYWISPESSKPTPYATNIRFSDGYIGWSYKEEFRFSCRPVRLVDVSSPAP